MRRIIKRNACGVARGVPAQPKIPVSPKALIVSGVGVCENDEGEDL